jgi:hypothetical protein
VSGRRGRLGGDDGTATAELAVCLPVLAMLLVLGLGGLALVRDQINCVAAARDIAIATARGEPAPSVEGAVVEINRDGDLIHVVVRRQRGLGLVPGLGVSATAVAAVEPGQ